MSGKCFLVSILKKVLALSSVFTSVFHVCVCVCVCVLCVCVCVGTVCVCLTWFGGWVEGD